MIDNSVLKRLAIQCGAVKYSQHSTSLVISASDLEKFAQAVIEDYKASLVPVAYVEYAWITDVDGLQSPEKRLLDYDNGNCVELYALPTSSKNELPSGETK